MSETDDTGAVTTTDLTLGVGNGWMLVGLDVEYNAGTDTMEASVWTVDEENPGVTNAAGPITIANDFFVDSHTYFTCVGAKMNAAGTDGVNGLGGVVKNVEFYQNSGQTTASVGALTSAACTGCCSICDSASGNCFTTTASPFYDRYDLHLSDVDPDWEANIPSVGGLGADLEINPVGTYLGAPFYVHEQGVHFNDQTLSVT